MSELFIRLYLDEDVSLVLGAVIRARGYEVLTTRDAGRRSTDDADQLAFAAERGMTILTHNRPDYDALATDYVDRGLRHAGIIAAVRHPVPELTKRLLYILDNVTADEMVNQVRYI